MSQKTKYLNYKENFLNSSELCRENKTLFKKYFVWQERKLKSINDLKDLDESCYKTLYRYVGMFKNVIMWFNYKPLKNIKKSEIRKVYEDLEDGKILNSNGAPFADRSSYYSKIFKSKLFKMIRKYEYAEEIIEFSKPRSNKDKVRYFSESDFKKASMTAIKLSHKLFLQIEWDIGENVMTVLQLQKKDICRRINETTNEPEYLINLPKHKIKRSRTPRTEPTIHIETVEFLDQYLEQGKKKFIPNPNGKNIKVFYENGTRKKMRGDWEIFPFKEDDYLFDFGHKQAEKTFRRAVETTGIKCQPDGERPTLKDLRSSMACYLLREGWTSDEVKARLGHKPSSREIDRYATYLAINRDKIKQRNHQSSIAKLEEELKSSKIREKQLMAHIDNQNVQIKEVKNLMKMYIEKQSLLGNLPLTGLGPRI